MANGFFLGGGGNGSGGIYRRSSTDGCAIINFIKKKFLEEMHFDG